LAEGVLEEIAKSWKKNGGGVIVEGDGEELKGILKNVEGIMVGGRIHQGKGLSRQNSFVFGANDAEATLQRLSERPNTLEQADNQSSIGMSELDLDDEDEGKISDPREWLKIVDAFEQPRLVYNVSKKHFEQ
jgi:DNA polymerase epsilon subunit 2